MPLTEEKKECALVRKLEVIILLMIMIAIMMKKKKTKENNFLSFLINR